MDRLTKIRQLGEATGKRKSQLAREYAEKFDKGYVSVYTQLCRFYKNGIRNDCESRENWAELFGVDLFAVTGYAREHKKS